MVMVMGTLGTGVTPGDGGKSHSTVQVGRPTPADEKDR